MYLSMIPRSALYLISRFRNVFVLRGWRTVKGRRFKGAQGAGTYGMHRRPERAALIDMQRMTVMYKSVTMIRHGGARAISDCV